MLFWIQREGLVAIVVYMKQLYVLDGSWYVFRAYYGLPPLHDADGHNVNAIFGFFRMLFKLRQEKPGYFVIAWDAPVKTVRKELDSEYKANRTKMPDEFKWQMGMIKELVGQLHIPAEEIPWFEADDIIGTIARRKTHGAWFEDDMGVTIVSSDKDLKQLVRQGQVVMFDAMKNITTTQKSFEEEYGFVPEHMVDYLAIVGDSADNIKWIPGIGKVWALKLVQQFGHMDDIYKNIDTISWALQRKLIDGKQEAYHSRTLTEIMTVPWFEEKDIAWWKYEPDFGHMHTVLVKWFGFNGLQKPIDELKKSFQSGEQLSLFG